MEAILPWKLYLQTSGQSRRPSMPGNLLHGWNSYLVLTIEMNPHFRGQEYRGKGKLGGAGADIGGAGTDIGGAGADIGGAGLGHPSGI